MGISSRVRGQAEEEKILLKIQGNIIYISMQLSESVMKSRNCRHLGALGKVSGPH
jgi:hypothetical protein